MTKLRNYHSNFRKQYLLLKKVIFLLKYYLDEKSKSIPVLANMGYKLLEEILKENTTIMEGLQDVNDSLKESNSKTKEEAKKYISSARRSTSVQRSIQTELEGDEIKMIAQMLSQKETEGIQLYNTFKHYL